MSKKILVTGGAGFIGSAVIRHLIGHTQNSVINVDKLTYAGNLESLSSVDKNERYQFHKIDICDLQALNDLFAKTKPDAIMHLAAESHVDRSIDGPADFIQTNIVGTFNLLCASLAHWKSLSGDQQKHFRFHHISTDEVFGDLEPQEPAFTETHSYKPSSPYSASKASADHLVRAWHRTYGLPVILTNCSNNYGPFHFPEKLIPLAILNALEGKPIPVYGKGEQVRDWLFVEDHARALSLCLDNAKIGESYNIGGNAEHRNIDVVTSICKILDEVAPQRPGAINSYAELITHVTDRPGHDHRYAMNIQKIQNDLDWAPTETFTSGLRKTVLWFIENEAWCKRALAGKYQRQRLGTNA